MYLYYIFLINSAYMNLNSNACFFLKQKKNCTFFIANTKYMNLQMKYVANLYTVRQKIWDCDKLILKLDLSFQANE